MDTDALLGMIFVLMIIGMVAGVIVLFPITMRLGKVLERRSLDAAAAPPRPSDDRLADALQSLQAEVERLSERQAFIEKLIAEREPLLIDAPAPRPTE